MKTSANFVHVSTLTRTQASREPTKPAKYESPYPGFVPPRPAAKTPAATPTVDTIAPSVPQPDLNTFAGRVQQRWRSGGLAVLGALTVLAAIPFAAPAAATAGVASVIMVCGLGAAFVGAGTAYSLRGQ